MDGVPGTTAGPLLTAYVLYLLGGWLGRDLTRALIGRIPPVAVAVAGLVTLFVAKKLRKRRERVTV